MTELIELSEYFKKLHWSTCYTRGGLKEIIRESKPITFKAAAKLIGCGLYTRYCYDSRIRGHRFLLKDREHNLGLPTWINATEESICFY